METSFLAVVIATIPFFLTLCSFYTQVILILILINVQYLRNVIFSFEKSSNGQIHSSDSHHLIKKNPPSKISHLPHWLFGKPYLVSS